MDSDKLVTLGWIQQYHEKLKAYIASLYAPKATTYTKDEVDALVSGGVSVETYTKAQIDQMFEDLKEELVYVSNEEG